MCAENVTIYCLTWLNSAPVLPLSCHRESMVTGGKFMDKFGHENHPLHPTRPPPRSRHAPCRPPSMPDPRCRGEWSSAMTVGGSRTSGRRIAERTATGPRDRTVAGPSRIACRRMGAEQGRSSRTPVGEDMAEYRDTPTRVPPTGLEAKTDAKRYPR